VPNWQSQLIFFKIFSGNDLEASPEFFNANFANETNSTKNIDIFAKLALAPLGLSRPQYLALRDAS
jgi:hypothetical protein